MNPPTNNDECQYIVLDSS